MERLDRPACSARHTGRDHRAVERRDREGTEDPGSPGHSGKPGRRTRRQHPRAVRRVHRCRGGKMVPSGEGVWGEDRLTARMDTFARLVGIVSASWMSQAACVAAELRIADLLAGGPKRVDELAKAAGCHAPSLARFMRALTSFEICVERNDGSFELTPMGSLLRADAPNSLRSWTIMCGKHQWPVWGNLLHSVRTGESARKLVRGT